MFGCVVTSLFGIRLLTRVSLATRSLPHPSWCTLQGTFWYMWRCECDCFGIERCFSTINVICLLARKWKDACNYLKPYCAWFYDGFCFKAKCKMNLYGTYDGCGSFPFQHKPNRTSLASPILKLRKIVYRACKSKLVLHLYHWYARNNAKQA